MQFIERVNTFLNFNTYHFGQEKGTISFTSHHKFLGSQLLNYSTKMQSQYSSVMSLPHLNPSLISSNFLLNSALKMDELFMGIDNRSFKLSMADSTMMCILHTAMNKAHEKVRSKEGVIERLNEQSKFCELAIMQLEACLKFVQEEADDKYNILEMSSYDKLLSDLTDIKDRLNGRLRETEYAIAEKDRELAETKEALRRSRSEDEEMMMMRRREGDFCELKNSVDQQFWSIKQHLEGEKMAALTRRMSQESSVSTILDDSEALDAVLDEVQGENDDLSPSKRCFDKMGLEIDRLKETLDTAFGIMQSSISSSGFDVIRPLEVKWMQKIENDIYTTLVKEFMMNLQENLVNSTGVFSKFDQQFLSDLMNDVTLLRNELEAKLVSSDKVTGVKNSLKLSQDKSGEFVVKDDEELKKPVVDEGSKEEDEDEGGNLVAKMRKKHESIIRTKSEELNWLKAIDLVREKSLSSSSAKAGKDAKYSLEKGRIEKVIARLDDFLKWKAELEKARIPCIEDEHVVKEESRVISKNDDEENEMRNIKQQLEDLSLQFVAMEEIYNCLFKCFLKDFEIELQEHDIRSSIREGVCNDLVKETIKQLIMCTKKKAVGDYKLMFRLKEGIFQLIIADLWSNEFEDYRFEHLIKEDVYHCVILETMKDCQDLLKDKYSATKKTENKQEVNGENESLIQRLDSLLSDKEIEDLWIKQSCETTKEESVCCKDFDNLDSKETTDMLQDEVTFNEVSSKLEKALHQLGSSKSLLKELGYTEETKTTEENNNSLQMVVDDDQMKYEFAENGDIGSQNQDHFEDHMPQNLDVGHDEIIMSTTFSAAKEIEGLVAKFVDSEFSSVLGKFEGVVEQKMNMINSRLQMVNNQVKPLMEHIGFLRNKELLYKKAFVRRCQNLQKAETEVDILGDQVDALTGLLKRIYKTLDYYSPVLQHCSGVLDILIWIRKELHLGVVAYKPQHRLLV